MKNKVAFMIPTLTNGGAERVVSNLSCGLSDNIDSKIILYNGNKIDYPYKGEIIDLNITTSSNPVSKLKALFKRIYRLKKIKKENNMEKTISFLDNPNIVNLLSRGKGETIISVRNLKSNHFNEGYGWGYKRLIKLLYNKADKIIVLSRMVKLDLVENFNIDANRIEVIYNPCDVEKINRLANEDLEREYKEIFKNPVIINIGRLTKQKGQWHLIRAFSKIKKEIPNAKLVILGQGELEDYLKELANNLGLIDDVHFLGFQKNPFKFIKNSTVFAFSSLYEGFGNVITEAMACGIPVVSTDCKAGPREILAPNTDIRKSTKAIEYAKYGILVPVCDGVKYNYNDSLTTNEEYLSQAVIDLIKNRDIMNIYINLFEERLNDFKIKKIINEWVDICNN
ncbi:glycosyltransferase [Halonatronum saccharophilum]|uniref:glycosyltransferase n=1 Tax=Halonatronum saccharophilum TaxID=150060 RepID=UPI00047F2990|nr:glycosyltransferase [Halonatronum saccharophilum]